MTDAIGLEWAEKMLAVENSALKEAAIRHLRAAQVCIAGIPEDEAGSDHGNLSSATDHIEAARSRLGDEARDYDFEEGS